MTICVKSYRGDIKIKITKELGGISMDCYRNTTIQQVKYLGHIIGG